MTAPLGVHFCGSIRLSDDPEDGHDEIQGTERVLRSIGTLMRDRLLRIPDGEVGARCTFCGWQAPVVLKTPWIASDMTLQMCGLRPEDYPPGNLEDVALGDVGYDEYALRNYKVFSKLKHDGIIDHHTRFQVCLPTPLNPVSMLVKQQYKEQVEPMYEARIVTALERIQAQIPHHELAIQWDCPMEVLFLEGLTQPFMPHFEVNMHSVVERLKRLAGAVREGVQLGFHLCYGDFNHRHAVEPTDMALMIDMVNALSKDINRPINWVHMPVPIERKDAAYFAPLEQLQLRPETEVYLGLVHAGDLEGTRLRISTVQKVVSGLRFGVATECGLGRTSTADIASILDILQAVSTPVAS